MPTVVVLLQDLRGEEEGVAGMFGCNVTGLKKSHRSADKAVKARSMCD